MKRRRAHVRLAAVLVVVLTTIVAGGVAHAQNNATLDPISGAVRAGDVVAVTGRGWPAGQMVSASICGRGGANGSAYCNLQNASVFPITRDGVLVGRATVAVPVEPCPCVLQVFAAGAGTTKATPIEIEGAPYAELPPGVTLPSTSSDGAGERTPTPPDPTLRIDAVSIEDTSSWAAIFGAASSRVLHLTATNTGTLPVRNPFFSVRYGKGENPDFVVETPEVAVIAPNETVSVAVPFELGALSFGGYTVAGDLGVVGNRVGFRGSTSTWPWGLLVVAAVLLQLVVLLILGRNRRRRRLREAELAANAESPADSAPAAGEIGVARGVSSSEEPPPLAPGNGSAEQAAVEGPSPGHDRAVLVGAAGASSVARSSREPAESATSPEPAQQADDDQSEDSPGRRPIPVGADRHPPLPSAPTRLTGPVTAAPWT